MMHISKNLEINNNKLIKSNIIITMKINIKNHQDK